MKLTLHCSSILLKELRRVIHAEKGQKTPSIQHSMMIPAQALIPITTLLMVKEMPRLPPGFPRQQQLSAIRNERRRFGSE